MTKISIVGRNMGHQNSHAAALAEGLTALGIESKRYYSSEGVRSPVVACWGWRLGKRLREAGADVLVMERGYLGDRFTWTSIAWNGLNGHARFPATPDDGGERFRKYFGNLMKPWQEGGHYVLLLGQVPGDASLKGRDLRPWYAECARRAAKRFGLPVMFRPHPLAHRRGGEFMIPDTKMQRGSLAEGLAGAAVAIGYNSNSMVESVLAGVPTICIDRGSMAFDMCSHDIDAPLVRPDRERWAHDLAWKQWSIQEIRSGAALRVTFPRQVTEAA